MTLETVNLAGHFISSLLERSLHWWPVFYPGVPSDGEIRMMNHTLFKFTFSLLSFIIIIIVYSSHKTFDFSST